MLQELLARSTNVFKSSTRGKKLKKNLKSNKGAGEID